MAERVVDLDHATLNRWVEKYASAIAEEVHHRKAPTTRSWRMDETYVKVKGQWTYLYRAIDKDGKTLDFMLSARRDEAAATAFFVKAVGNNGWCWLITVRRKKYLNNITEQDQRFIKKLTCPMQTFKSFNSASATLAGIEVAHMIRKGQFRQAGQSGFVQSAAFAG